jgi:ribonuclease T1
VSDQVRPADAWLAQAIRGRFVAAALQVLVAGSVLAGSLAFAPPVLARPTSALFDTTQTSVNPAELPEEAVGVHRQILNGGPFGHPDKDGSVFANRERLLLREARGYYREYTVPTPGSRDRGARRIVCGGSQPKTPDVCYYTQDHYASFRRIAP